MSRYPLCLVRWPGECSVWKWVEEGEGERIGPDS